MSKYIGTATIAAVPYKNFFRGDLLLELSVSIENTKYSRKWDMKRKEFLMLLRQPGLMMAILVVFAILIIFCVCMIEQVGTAMEIYSKPESIFVAGFIGKANFVRVDEVKDINNGSANIILFGHEMNITAAENCKGAKSFTCMIRPEDIVITPDGRFTAQVTAKAYFGQYVQYILNINGQEIELMDFSQVNANIPEGAKIRVDVMESSLRLIASDSQKE